LFQQNFYWFFLFFININTVFFVRQFVCYQKNYKFALSYKTGNFILPSTSYPQNSYTFMNPTANNMMPQDNNKLDKIDHKILRILQENSKITNLDLSKQIGLSPAPTLERVKKLEQSGVIESYHAQVNPQTVGLNVKTFVLVSLAWQKSNALNNFLEKIKGIDEIVECYIITGEADFIMKIVSKDIPSYEQLLFKTLSQIEEIERVKTLMTLSTVKDTKVLPYRFE
jgi:Lrp/AsnC family leucine-responsive transcriptional regulator